MIGWARKRAIDLYPLARWPCFMSQRGDSGQKNIPHIRTKDGINAEPSWRRQAMLPVSLTMTLAQKPKKIPAGDSQRMSRDGEQIAAYQPQPKVARTWLGHPEFDAEPSQQSRWGPWHSLHRCRYPWWIAQRKDLAMTVQNRNRSE